MEFLRDHAMEIIQWLWPPFAQHLDYAINAEAHVQALTRATEELRCKRKDVEGDHGEGPSRKRRKLMMTHQAQHWIDQLTDIEKEADSIKSEFEERRRRFLNGRLTDYVSCYNLGKRAVEMLNAVKYLNEKGPLGQAVVSPPRPKVVQMQESLPSGQSTSQETLEEIWQCLQDDDTRIVCLYGMGGVGKTTLMKTINNRLIGTQDFDVVIWVTVTKKFDLEKIQKEIGNILCLDFQDEIQKSDKLFAVLKDMKYMLILDDLWHEFILEEAGIPRPNRQNGCKIAITTRFIHVSNGMQADKNFRVKTLTREESWNLFCNKAGEVARLPGIQSVAEEIAMECGGLPRAIATVGRTMRCKEKKELWLDALRSLRRSAPEAPGMAPKVFLSLKLSYDHLEDEKVKLCFLYCAMFPQDHNLRIRKLVRFWTMEGLIDSVENLKDTLNKGHSIIERLKEACLLEEGQPKDTHVKMHDLIRDLVVWITSSPSHTEPKFLVRARAELKVPPREEMWEDMVRISLMWNDIEELPDRPNCPKLVSLLLSNNPQLDTIPSSFCDLMPKLQVLDLSYTAIKSLPPSLSLLVNLRALVLKCCSRLADLPPFGQLKELKFVDLSSSGISKLPEDFGGLVKLKQLKLSNLDLLRRIPHNVISRLSNLEDLRLLQTYVNWAVEGGSQDMGEATLREVAMLKHLTTFKITIPSIDWLGPDIFNPSWQNLRKFVLHVGYGWSPDRLSCENRMQLHGCDHFTRPSKTMIKDAEGLSFAECRGLTRISQVVGDSKTLRQLQVSNFKGIDCVIDWREVEEGALRRLEWICLDGLLNLKMLFEGEVPQGCLQHLRSIEVSCCKKLRCLFASTVVDHLVGLEELTVQSCDEMVEIVEGDTLPNNQPFPRLRQLRVERLCNLTRIISSTASALTSLQEVEVFKCPSLKKLPSCTSIQKIKGEREWWDAVEWEDESTRSLFHQKYHQWPSFQIDEASA